MKCSVPDCNTVVHCNGLCKKHDTRMRRHGDVNANKIVKPEINAFIKDVLRLKLTEGECVIYPFAKSHGYANLGPVDGKNQHLHVLLCEFYYGPKPSEKHEVAHSCDNRSCVRPAHLRWATRSENNYDRSRSKK